MNQNMYLKKKFLIFNVLITIMGLVHAQRSYVANSVLSSGNWYKIAVSASGVYKIDVSFLKSLGITGSIPSAQLRIFSNSTGMLPEANNVYRPDDLQENSIMVIDGGDGVLDGSDYILFYGQGPDKWLYNAAGKHFYHQKNLFSEQSYYYLTIGGLDLRIPNQSNIPLPSVTVTTFDEHFFHELDSINFLASGKEWYGEEFSNTPGRQLSRSFTIPYDNFITGSPVTLSSSVLARSAGSGSQFTIDINNTEVQRLSIAATGPGIYDLFAQQSNHTDNFLLNVPAPVITINYLPGSFNSQGWLNWFEFLGRRSLLMGNANQILFRDWNSVGTGAARFIITNPAPNTMVWDITDTLHPVNITVTNNGNNISFDNDSRILHEYIGFSSAFPVPKAIGKIAVQNLHKTSPADFFIITDPAFLSQAMRLAAFHQQRENIIPVVVTTDEVFNEFSGGIPDPTAMRDFIKMYYDKYKSIWGQSSRNLLLFGSASFDYKSRISVNSNFVPCYESNNSLDPLSTYTSDDFFGLLDDQDDINSGLVVNQLKIGIGRVPCRNFQEAKDFVDKVIDYYSSSSFGPWRNNMDFIADDQDNNLHLQDAETLSATVSSVAPFLNERKIYLDAFKKEGGTAGGSYPQVNAIINSNIYNGTLLWNFTGHGGSQRLTEENIVDQQIINNWNNQYRLPLFITATCDFAPFDNPLGNSLGENLLLRPKTGAIGLMTTTRVVFAYSNLIINNNYLNFALQPLAGGHYRSLGQAAMSAKNYTYLNSGDIINNRKFILIGDPQLTIAYPFYKVRTSFINGHDFNTYTDTLKATENVLIEGEAVDNAANIIKDFQGTVNLTLFDKPKTIRTLGNDPTSIPVGFQDQENILFRGKATVTNGKFSIRFKMPRDINYQFGNGKISFYAHNGSMDANGYTNKIVVGGNAVNTSSDRDGPDIKAYLNDEKFVSGSITNSDPILILHLSDSSGINTGSSGIGHDLVATLDNNNQAYYVLNNYYESDLDNYQKGTVRYQLPSLTEGRHTLKITAWDVLDNSSNYSLDFVVVNSEKLRIDHVLNYPNPFTTKTAFWFEHNLPGTDLYVKVEVFTVSGKLIKTISKTINTAGNRSNDIEWDGKDENGNKLGRGVYVYLLKVRSFDGKTADKWERLVIL